MPMVRAMRLLNSIEAGTTDGTKLETLLNDDGRLSEFNSLLGMRGQAKRIAYSPTSINAITSSIKALDSFWRYSCQVGKTLETLMSIINSTLASLATTSDVFSNSTAMTAIINSVDAMNAVYNSTIAKSEVLNNNIALNAILTKSNTAIPFNSTASAYISVTALSSTKALVCYAQSGNSYHGTACVLTISGTTVTAGTPFVFQSATSYYIKVAALSETKAIVIFSDISDYGKAYILEINNTTITKGAIQTWWSASVSYFDIKKLDTDKALIVGSWNTYGRAITVTVTGTTMAFGDTNYAPIGNFNFTLPSIAILSSTKALVCCKRDSNGYGEMFILSISGSTITSSAVAGSPVYFSYANVGEVYVEKLSETSAVVCIKNSGSGYGESIALSISETTITAGSAVTFESASTGSISVTALSSTKALVCYRDGGNSNYGTACVLTISGTTVTAGTPFVIKNSSVGILMMVNLNGLQQIVCYANSSNYGNAMIIG